MDRLKHLVAEIHRRSLWQVLGVYLLASWVVLGAVDTVSGVLGLPDWVPPFALVLLFIGLPIVLATALVQEGAARGETAEAPEGVATPAPDRTFLQRHLTWRRAMSGGIAGFAVLGLLVGGYFLSWGLGVGPVGSLLAAGELEEGDRIVVADFEAPSDDPALGAVVAEALRIDFQEHPVVRVVDGTQVQDALRRMQVTGEERLTAELAREVALREGLSAVLEGEVARVGTGYVVTASLRSAGSGESLARLRETADGPDALIPAIERLSERIRERAGESLRSIRAGPQLEQVTTSSLQALRLLTEANRAEELGDAPRSARLLEEAVEADPGFGMAWRRLAVILGNTGLDPWRAREATERAYELRGRLSPRERYSVEALYYRNVLGDLNATAEAYERVLEIDPHDRIALNNLALVASSRLDYERAIELQERIQELPDPTPVNFSNLVLYRITLGHLEEARQTHARFSEAFAGHPTEVRTRALLDFHGGDDQAARRVLEDALAEEAVHPATRWALHLDLARMLVWRGRIEEARQHLAAAEAAAGEVDDRLRWPRRIDAAVFEVLVGDPERGAGILLDGQRDLALGELPPADRMYAPRVLLLGIAGRSREARAVLEEWEAEIPAEERGVDGDVVMDLARALVLIQEGRPGEAVELVESTRSARRCSRCDASLMGWALRDAGDLEAAAEEWAISLTPLESSALSNYVEGYFWTLERLAPLHEELGEPERALELYRGLVELWDGADAELQPRVERARERLGVLEPVVGQR